MLGKSLINGIIRTRSSILSLQSPKIIVRNYRMQGPPQPFDNLPFTVPNRYAATIFFVFFFGIGFWAPYVVLWYQMAKRTM